MRRNAVVLIADKRQFPAAYFVAHRVAPWVRTGGADVVIASDSSSHLSDARQLSPEVKLLDTSSRAVNYGAQREADRSYYFTLDVPLLLADKYDRIIYLDADTYPESESLLQLFDLDMEGMAVAGVRDQFPMLLPNETILTEMAATLGPELGRRGGKYLNAGVLLIDIHAYERANISRRAGVLGRSGRIELAYYDQTLFNAVLRTHWLELSPGFNLIKEARHSVLAKFTKPVVTHFAGPVKPWHFGFSRHWDHPVAGEMASFMKASPWPDFMRVPVDTRTPAPRRERQPSTFDRETRDLLADFLQSTRFADVAQGLSAANYNAIRA